MYEIAKKMYGGNEISAADKLLGDFRRGFMGLCSLEVPPVIASRRRRALTSEDSLKRAGEKVEGREGEAAITQSKGADNADGLDIGRGNYDGW